MRGRWRPLPLLPISRPMRPGRLLHQPAQLARGPHEPRIGEVPGEADLPRLSGPVNVGQLHYTVPAQPHIFYLACASLWRLLSTRTGAVSNYTDEDTGIPVPYTSMSVNTGIFLSSGASSTRQTCPRYVAVWFCSKTSL